MTAWEDASLQNPHLVERSYIQSLFFGEITLDAFLAGCLFGELEDGESGWSPYQKSLERQLFQAPKTPEAESRKPRTSKRTAAEPEAPRLNQCSLL